MSDLLGNRHYGIARSRTSFEGALGHTFPTLPGLFRSLTFPFPVLRHLMCLRVVLAHDSHPSLRNCPAVALIPTPARGACSGCRGSDCRPGQSAPLGHL